MIKKLLTIIIIGMFVAGCDREEVLLEEDLTPRFDKAMEYFERALNIDPNYVDARKNLELARSLLDKKS